MGHRDFVKHDVQEYSNTIFSCDLPWRIDSCIRYFAGGGIFKVNNFIRWTDVYRENKQLLPWMSKLQEQGRNSLGIKSSH